MAAAPHAAPGPPRLIDPYSLATAESSSGDQQPAGGGGTHLVTMQFASAGGGDQQQPPGSRSRAAAGESPERRPCSGRVHHRSPSAQRRRQQPHAYGFMSHEDKPPAPPAPPSSGRQQHPQQMYLQLAAPVGEQKAPTGARGANSGQCPCNEANCPANPSHGAPRHNTSQVHGRMLSGRPASGHHRRAAPSPIPRCEAVQITDLKVAALGGGEMTSRPRSGFRPDTAGTRSGGRKHHVVVIQRGGAQQDGTSNASRHQVVGAGSYDQLQHLAMRYADPRRLSSSTRPRPEASEHRAPTTVAVTTAPLTPATPRTVTASPTPQRTNKDYTLQEKAKTVKQVRINSAVQVHEPEPPVPSFIRHRQQQHDQQHVVHTVGHAPVIMDRGGGSSSRANTLRQLVQNREEALQVTGSRKQSHMSELPDGIPSGSIVRIQHTSKGRIKVISGTDDNLTTTILEPGKKKSGGYRPAATVDLVDDVLVISRKKDKEHSGHSCHHHSKHKVNYNAFENLKSDQDLKGILNKQRSHGGGVYIDTSPNLAEHQRQDGSPSRKNRDGQHNHLNEDYLFENNSRGRYNSPRRKAEMDNPYKKIEDCKNEALERGESAIKFYYQSVQDRSLLGSMPRIWNPDDSVPHNSPTMQKANSTQCILKDDNIDCNNSQRRNGAAAKQNSPDDFEPELVSPNRYRWELEYDDYSKVTPKVAQKEENLDDIQEDSDNKDDKDINREDLSKVVDAQTLYAEQVYQQQAARATARSRYREQHPQTNQPVNPLINSPYNQPLLPQKHQLWSRETLMQASTNRYMSKVSRDPPMQFFHAMNRSPSARRRSQQQATRSRSRTPNTNIVADQLPANKEQDKTAVAGVSAELINLDQYEDFAHSKNRSKNRPGSTKSRPQVVDKDTMVKLLHMTMPRKQMLEQNVNE